MSDKRIRDLLDPLGAMTEHLFCTIHRVDGNRIVTLFSSHPQAEELGSWQPTGVGVVGQVVASGKSVSVGAVREASWYIGVYPSVESELAIPVLREGHVVGIINFESTLRDAFDDDQETRFHDLAARLQDYFLPARSGDSDAFLIPEISLWKPLERDHVQVTLEEVSDALLQQLARKPDLMHQLSPRKFEELVARVLSDLGLKVTLTPPIKDGGFDMLAELVTPLGTVLTLVECKKYSPNRPVSVEIVRNLYGVLNLQGATRALIATTSRFTADARALQDAVKYRLELRDYQNVASWLARYDLKE